jgi:hypothetical protein
MLYNPVHFIILRLHYNMTCVCNHNIFVVKVQTVQLKTTVVPMQQCMLRPSCSMQNLISFVLLIHGSIGRAAKTA